jgi:hypothetical protein
MPSHSTVATSPSHHNSSACHHHHKTSSSAYKTKSQVPSPSPPPPPQPQPQTSVFLAGMEVTERHLSASADASTPGPQTHAASTTYADPKEPVLCVEMTTGPQLSSDSRAGVTDLSRTDNTRFSSLRLPGALQNPDQPTTSTHRGMQRPKSAEKSSSSAADMTAVVHAKGYMCTLTYFTVKDSLRITRTTSAGKVRTVLNIPMHMVINVETAAERDERQRARQTNDDAVKTVFFEGSAGAGLLCAYPTGAMATSDENDALVFAHSRVNTDTSVSGNYSGGLFFQQHSLTSPSAMSNRTTSPMASAATQIRYYVHYIRQRNRERPSIHTLEFLSHGSAEHVQTIVNALVQRIYRKGPKHIIVFISPKSGKGKGVHVFDKHVRPLLHFSRHTYQTCITQRAHDCEDYVANLSHPMNSSTVVAAVGGDGMINEVVNGVHRRKLAFVRWLRSVTTDVGPRGFTEDSSQRLGDEGSSCVFGLDPQALATVSDGTSTTVALTKAPNTPEPQGASPTTNAAPYNLAAVGGAPIVQQDVENKRECRTTPADMAAVEARQLARRLVEDGWDGLMPLIATVPAGSACGLAKSLDVLSVAESAMALVHLSTVHMDLLHMSFSPNKEMMAYQRGKLSLKKLTAARQNFAKYCQDNQAELQERAVAAATVAAMQQQMQQENEEEREVGKHPRHIMSALSATDSTPPFLKDGANVYTDEVGYALKMPYFKNRVAFMSLSFGAANDIDHGSEPLRWMGNARFHVYGGYMMLLGLKRYNGVLRYLPWQSKSGKTMEKLHTRHAMPSADDFPICTMRDDCPHCQTYTFTHCGQGSLASSTGTAEKHTGNTPNMSRDAAGAAGGSSAAATLAPYTDAELLDEDSVDFNDENLPWVTIRGEFCIVLMCNVRDVAQDMLMAPLSHMSDGAIDVVYCRIDPSTGRGGRMEMLRFFMGLESGKHVNLDFVNYVKARALEMKVDAGISMSDGELMPLSEVRMTKLRSSIQLVRNE